MSWWRKVLNLPEKDAEGGEELTDALANRVEKLAIEEVESRQNPQQAGGVGWAEEDESSGKAFVRKAGRITVWSVIALAALTGVRAWFFPAKPPAPVQRQDAQAEADKNNVPEAEAQQVAARFTRSYLTWSQSDPNTRAQELATDLPQGADSKLGWDGQGSELVAQTIPGAVTQTGHHQGRVLVDARVSVTSGKSTTSLWRALQVPVAVSGGRVVVTGQPALVGLPDPVPYTPPAAPDTDTGMTAATQQAVQDFLTAWAAGNQDQAAAPGAAIAPLGAGVQLDSLDAWSVDAGSGTKRTGTATVRWKVASAELQQTYRITLTQVSAAGASRWQVWQITSQ